MLRQKTRLGKSPVRRFSISNTKNITAQSLNHACHFNFRSFCINGGCGLVTCLARRCSEGLFAKKCSPRSRRLPSLNEPENFVKSLIRVYLFNFRSLGCCCRKGLVTCHARRCNKIRPQAKSSKWATIQIKSKISSASPSFYD